MTCLAVILLSVDLGILAIYRNILLKGFIQAVYVVIVFGHGAA